MPGLRSRKRRQKRGLNLHWTRAHKFAGNSFDVACIQCEHSHSQEQVPFACVCSCASGVDWAWFYIIWFGHCLFIEVFVHFFSVVMVVGAGRGPLVTASINAARQADRKIKVYAVEKNPNAIVTYELFLTLITIVVLSCLDVLHSLNFERTAP